MNREILFRGQTRKRGEKVRMDGTPVDGNWVYGGIFPGEGDFSIIYSSRPVEKHVVYTSTVGQYTGLTDKNGVKIFEGDLLSYNCGDEDSEPREVCFLNGRFVVQWVVSGDIDDRPYQTIRMAKVIGNIHDNPELIGGEDDG